MCGVLGLYYTIRTTRTKKKSLYFRHSTICQKNFSKLFSFLFTGFGNATESGKCWGAGAGLSHFTAPK